MKKFTKHKTLSNYFSNITLKYIEKHLTGTEIIVLLYIISESATGKSNVNTITLNEVETTFTLKKQRVQQIINKLKEHGLITPIYKVTTLTPNNKTFTTYNKARAFQKREGGQVYFYAVKLIKMSDVSWE